jgi:membrane associated rhomboid family serine protease
MVPLRDENPTRTLAWVTLLLIVLNVGVFVLLQPRGEKPAIVSTGSRVGWSADLTEAEFLYRQATVPCEIVSGQQLDRSEIESALRGNGDACNREQSNNVVFPAKQPALSILVSMFLHGGWLHLLGNMLFLWIFGNNIEDQFGRVKYLVAHVLANPNSLVPVVGASGAIAGVMGAYLVLFPRVRVTSVLAFLPIIPFRVRAWVLLGIWFVSQFWVNPADGVAWIAHVAGFAFGALLTFLFRSKLAPLPAKTLENRYA